MKNRFILVIVLMLTAAHPARADELTPATQGATFLGGAAVGAALGGPVGFVAGGLLGAWYAETVGAAAEVAESRERIVRLDAALLDAQESSSNLRQQLAESREQAQQYAELIFDAVQMEFLFRTDAAELTETGIRRLERIALFLEQHAEIAVALDAHSDPRGDAGYNQALSEARANAVAEQLVAAGIDRRRILARGHGESLSTAQEGDRDGYAMERIVQVRLAPAVEGAVANID
jgi:outer membrane protein OmpA-like peptidoglycan-associated protein